MIWFCKAMAGKVHALGLSGGGKAHSLRSQVVRGITAPPLAEARSTWQGGSFAPPCLPRTRAFRPRPPPNRTPIDQPSAVWTRARAFAPMDHEPEGVPPRCPCPLSRRSGAKAETLGGLDAARRHAPPKPLPRRVRPGPPALGRRTLGRGAYKKAQRQREASSHCTAQSALHPRPERRPLQAG